MSNGAGSLMGGPVGAAFAVGGAILGAIGMRRRRKEERRRRRREKAHALKAQQGLIGTIDDIRAEYAERAGFARQGFESQQASSIVNYAQDLRGAQSIVGQTGFSYSGEGERGKNLLTGAFQDEYQARNLQYKEGFAGLERQYEGELRDIQVGLLNLEAYSKNSASRASLSGLLIS